MNRLRRLLSWLRELTTLPKPEPPPTMKPGRYVVWEHTLPKLVEVVNVGGASMWHYASEHHLRTMTRQLADGAVEVGR